MTDLVPSANDTCWKYRSKDESSKSGKLSKNYHGRNKEFKKSSGTKIVGCSSCVLFNCLYYEEDG